MMIYLNCDFPVHYVKQPEGILSIIYHIYIYDIHTSIYTISIYIYIYGEVSFDHLHPPKRPFFSFHLQEMSPLLERQKIEAFRPFGNSHLLSTNSMGDIYIYIYPLVNIQIAIENDHRNSGFSH